MVEVESDAGLDIDTEAIENSDTSMETEQTQTSDVDVENLYMVEVPEFEESKILYVESEVYEEVEAYKMEKPYVDLQNFATFGMTKERYETLKDKKR